MPISSRLTTIIDSLNKEEFRMLGRFLKSPMLNSNKNLLKLYQVLRQVYPDLGSEKLSLELIHKKVFAGKIFNEKITRNLIYELCNNIESFLSFINYSGNKFAYQKHLLEELCSRKLSNYVKSNLNSADEMITEYKVKDEEYYSSKAFLERIRYSYELRELPMGKSLVLSNIKKEYFKNISNSFLVVLLKEYFEKHNIEFVIKTEIDTSLMDPYLKYLDDNIEKYKSETVIYLMYKFIKLKEDVGKEEYYSLKDLAIFNKENITAEYFKDFILELFNFSKMKERNGEKEFGQESFELIKYMDANSMLLETDGSIIEHNYTNIAANAIRQREVEWAFEFINKYKNHLPEKVKENAFNYNLATVNFIISTLSEGDEKIKYLDIALSYLSKVKTTDFYYSTRINNLQLLIYYEKNDLEPIYCLIDSYRHYIHSNKLIPDMLRKRYSNFINFMSRLTNLKSGTSRITLLDKLKIDVLQTETEYKKWLLDKIEEIEAVQ